MCREGIKIIPLFKKGGCMRLSLSNFMRKQNIKLELAIHVLIPDRACFISKSPLPLLSN